MAETAPLLENQSVHAKKRYSTVDELTSPTEDIATYQASVFVEDAIHYRSIHHKITPRALRVYTRHHHWSVQVLVTSAILILLLLAFFEYPTSINLSADFRYNNNTPHISELRCGYTESVELACLIVLLANLLVQFYIIGLRRFVEQRWLLLYALITFVSFVDLAVSLSFCIKDGQGSLGSTVRFRRFARPLFLVISSTYVKKFLKAAARTVKHIISILLLLLLHLFVFAMIGQLMYPRPLPSMPSSDVHNSSDNVTTGDSLVRPININTDNYSMFVHAEGTKYFNSVEDSLSSLLVYLTTSNNPDIMTPIYQYNRVSFLYFFTFLSIGLYLILNVLTAAIYTEFRGYLEKSLRGSWLRRQAALKAAFVILDKESQGSGASKQLVYRVLQNIKSQRRNAPEVYVQLCRSMNASSEHIDWRRFKHVFNSILRDKSPAQVNPEETYSPVKVVRWIQKLVRNWSFSYFVIVLMWVHVVAITLELEFDYVQVIRHCDSPLAYINLAFSVYYTIELLLKFVGQSNAVCNFSERVRGCCVFVYLRSFAHAYEFVITVMIIVTEVIILGRFGITSSDPAPASYASWIRIMNLLVVLRLLTIISMIPHMARVFAMMIEIFKNLRSFAAVLVTIYYLYALLGMELFGRNYRLDDETSARNNICGTYEQQDYYSYNFHDFASSLVVLWNLMVVNNWYVFKEAFVHATKTKWTQLYFISWWLVSVVITLNLFISLVIEIFVTQWEKEKERSRNLAGEGHVRNAEEDGVEQSNIDYFPHASDGDDVFPMLHHSFKEPTESELQFDIRKHKDLV